MSEENKKLDFKFEGGKLLLSVDLNKDGDKLLELAVDLSEAADEIIEFFKKDKEAE